MLQLPQIELKMCATPISRTPLVYLAQQRDVLSGAAVAAVLSELEDGPGFERAGEERVADQGPRLHRHAALTVILKMECGYMSHLKHTNIKNFHSGLS